MMQKIVTDSHFMIGSTHTVCQDYACDGVINGIQYAMISDGCSSAKDTDIGARLITMAFKNALAHPSIAGMLEMLTVDRVPLFGDILWDSFKIEIVKINQVCAYRDEATSYYWDALSATIMCLLTTNIGTLVFVNGDGVLGYSIDGEVYAHAIEFSQNAPEYPVYAISKESYEATFARAIQTVDVNDVFNNAGDNVTVKYTMSRNSFGITMLLPRNDMAFVASDGIQALISQREDFDPISEMRNVLTFKNMVAGQFVKRKLEFLKKNSWKEKTVDNTHVPAVSHTDDLSIAAIFNGKDNNK